MLRPPKSYAERRLELGTRHSALTISERRPIHGTTPFRFRVGVTWSEFPEYFKLLFFST
jgi:hypothetical protein